jgi:hypothetical protein
MKIQYENIAETYSRLRESDAAVVEKLILESGISGTSKIPDMLALPQISSVRHSLSIIYLTSGKKIALNAHVPHA